MMRQTGRPSRGVIMGNAALALRLGCRAIAVGVVLVAAFGCEDDPVNGQAGAGAATGTGAGGSSSAGGSGGAGGANSGGAPNEAPILAWVAQNSTVAGGVAWWTGFVSFFGSDPDKRCYARQQGDCVVVDCRSSVYGPAKAPWLSVGPVTIAGGVPPDVVLQPSTSSGVYSQANGNSTKYASGDVISFSAPGDELPGFNVNVTVPVVTDFLEPDVENLANGELHISRAQAFSVTWQPTSAMVSVELYEGADADANQADFFDVVCSFDGQSGAGEIPAEIMTEFDGSLAVEGMNLGTDQRVEEPVGTRTLWASAYLGSGRDVVIE